MGGPAKGPVGSPCRVKLDDSHWFYQICAGMRAHHPPGFFNASAGSSSNKRRRIVLCAESSSLFFFKFYLIMILLLSFTCRRVAEKKRHQRILSAAVVTCSWHEAKDNGSSYGLLNASCDVFLPRNRWPFTYGPSSSSYYYSPVFSFHLADVRARSLLCTWLAGDERVTHLTWYTRRWGDDDVGTCERRDYETFATSLAKRYRIGLSYGRPSKALCSRPASGRGVLARSSSRSVVLWTQDYRHHVMLLVSCVSVDLSGKFWATTGYGWSTVPRTEFWWLIKLAESNRSDSSSYCRRCRHDPNLYSVRPLLSHSPDDDTAIPGGTDSLSFSTGISKSSWRHQQVRRFLPFPNCHPMQTVKCNIETLLALRRLAVPNRLRRTRRRIFYDQRNILWRLLYIALLWSFSAVRVPLFASILRWHWKTPARTFYHLF